MKHNKYLAVILIVLLIFQQFPAYAFAVDTGDADPVEEVHEEGTEGTGDAGDPDPVEEEEEEDVDEEEEEEPSVPYFDETPYYIIIGKNASYNLTTDDLAFDPQGRALTYTIDEEPQYGEATIEDDILTYTPNINYTGTDSFVLLVSNGVNTANCVFYVTIDSLAPVAVDDEVIANSTDESFLIRFS